MDFRRKALDSLRAPEELDSPVGLARPRAWVALVVVAAVMAGALVWCCYGTIPQTVAGTGFLTYPQGVSALQGPYIGNVGAIFADANTLVPAGTPVMSIVSSEGKTQIVRAPFQGIVTSVLVTSDQFVNPGTTLADIERTDAIDEHMQARVYIPASQAADVQVGDKVALTVSSAPAAAFGVMYGTVASVDQFPATRQQILDFLGGNELLASNFLKNGDPAVVTVQLNPDSSTASGFQWSTKTGPPFQLEIETLVSAGIALPGERPITWVLPG